MDFHAVRDPIDRTRHSRDLLTCLLLRHWSFTSRFALWDSALSNTKQSEYIQRVRFIPGCSCHVALAAWLATLGVLLARCRPTILL